MIRLVYKLRESLKKFNKTGAVLFDEPLAAHTAFRVGGPADAYLTPGSESELRDILTQLRAEGIPCFILGGGANILVSDRGVRGAVIDLRRLSGIHRRDSTVEALAGTPMPLLAATTVEMGLAGLERFAAMPGSVGGSIWMNARCYGVSLSERLTFVDILDSDGTQRRVNSRSGEFGYKRSPFQRMDAVILRGGFTLRRGRYGELRAEAQARRVDRERKGHFRYPCAGSAFRNNTEFGAPTGRIIDSLGLRGFTIGRAAVSESHANIVVNLGGASATDVRRVIDHVKRRVRESTGFLLEEEVLYVGDWSGYRAGEEG